VGLLLSDSTNVDVPEPGRGERFVGATLDRLVREGTGRVFITLFASNVQRLVLLGEVAQRAGRKICLLGRSLGTQVDIATRIQRLRWPSDLVVPVEVAQALPRSSALVLAGGTQGEARSAMARLAEGTYTGIGIEPGDAVILSSRIIPGNERAVFRMIGNLLRLGAHVVHRVTDPGVHTSGHATRAEQRRMLTLLQPRCFVPVHGTLHHLTRHAELARDAGIEQVQVVENGTPVIFDGDRVVPGAPVVSGRVAVAPGGEPVTAQTIRERLELARSGIVTLLAALDDRGRLVGKPQLSCRGVVGADAYPGEVRRIEKQVEQVLRRPPREATLQRLREEVRVLVRREFFRVSGVRPIVEVHLLGGRP
jgi:ribonuclease J